MIRGDRARRRLLGLAFAVPLLFLAAHLLTRGAFEVAAVGPSSRDIRVLLGARPGTLAIDADLLLLDDGEPLGASAVLRAAVDAVVLEVGDRERRLATPFGLAWYGTARLRLDDGPERFDDGRLEVGLDEDARLRLVLVTPIEPYLTGVLAREMGRSFPPAALEAQAVAARSYAVQCARRAAATGRDFDLFDDTRSQGYGGISDSPPLRKAVRATRGLVLARDGRVLRAYYGSVCGGRTRDGHERFRDVPVDALPSVVCGGCDGAPLFEWRRQLDAASLRRLVPGLGPGPLALSPTATSPRGDWLGAVAVAGRGEPVPVPLDALARAFRLPSTWITGVERLQDGLALVGHGFGHGVGLCQRGAEAWAGRGEDFRAILARYYPGADLVPLEALGRPPR
ncbi:MAG: SpoIID/LytB domain-containing protein [Planctomycetota bacterium]